MYHLTTLLVAILTSVSAPCVLGQVVDTSALTFDTKYDDGSLPMNQMSCLGDAKANLAQFPNFPFIGGAPGAEVNIPRSECGLCYAVKYNNTTVAFTVVDHADVGFVVSKTAMEVLTKGDADATSSINVTFSELLGGPCKM